MLVNRVAELSSVTTCTLNCVCFVLNRGRKRQRGRVVLPQHGVVLGSAAWNCAAPHGECGTSTCLCAITEAVTLLSTATQQNHPV